MAQNMTPEEIQAEFAAYAEAVKNGTSNTKEWNERMKDAEAGVKNYTAALNSSLKSLGTSTLATMGALKDGATGASVFNNSLEKGADAVSDFASKFGIIGAIIGAVVKAATAYVVAVNKQSDALFKSYQDISKVGATGADGMTGVFESMQKFGYGIDDLGKMSALIKANSGELATFGGSVAAGTKQLASLAGELQHSSFARDMREMGVSIDDINQGAAGYIKNQVAIGKNSATIDRDLAANAAAYIKELNTMSKLTGQSREQLQASLDASNKQEAQNQVLFELDQKIEQFKGTAEGEMYAAQKKKLEALQQNTAIPKALRDELAKAIGGDAAAATTLMQVAPRLLGAAMETNKSYDDTMDIAAQDLKRTLAAYGPSAAMNLFNQMGVPIDEARKMVAQYTGENAKELREKAEKEGKVIDPLAKAAVANEISQNNTRDAMQSMLQAGIIPVTKGMAGLSSVIEKVTGTAAGAVGAAPAGGAAPLGGGGGGGGGGAAPAGGEPTVGTSAGPEILRLFKKLYGIPESGGGGEKAAAPASGATLSPDKAVTGKDLAGVNGQLAGAVKAAATEFMAISGKPVTVTSAVRTPEEQEKLWADYQAGKAKYPVAPPGKSKHDRGAALDIDSSTADAMDQKGLLAKYGLGRPVPNDPVHIELAKGMAEGGIASGPTSGYQANLQGTNAVVPLPSGQQIPVDMPEFNTNLTDQTQILSQQLAKLDDLVRVMQTQVGVSTKILQSAN